MSKMSPKLCTDPRRIVAPFGSSVQPDRRVEGRRREVHIALGHRQIRMLRRRVAHDAMVHVDTVRYSVPHRLVREHVDVAIDEQGVRIFHGGTLVVTHARPIT